ncbi:MAG: nuclear transport factor 2 family protein [Puniceicoccaceae bacterium]
MKPDFDSALQQHFDAISNRDIEAFKSHLTRNDTLYTIVQNGYAFKTPGESIAIHEEWFRNPDWTWKGKVMHRVVGQDVAMALVRYEYRPKPEDAPLETWLTYVFELQDGQWRIVHDHNTALDFPAFARAMGMDAE